MWRGWGTAVFFDPFRGELLNACLGGRFRSAGNGMELGAVDGIYGGTDLRDQIKWRTGGRDGAVFPRGDEVVLNRSRGLHLSGEKIACLIVRDPRQDPFFAFGVVDRELLLKFRPGDLGGESKSSLDQG